MSNIYFLIQSQYINKRKGYENISKGSLQEKLALTFNQILSTSSLCLEISRKTFFVVIGKDKKWIVPRCLSFRWISTVVSFLRAYVREIYVRK